MIDSSTPRPQRIRRRGNATLAAFLVVVAVAIGCGRGPSDTAARAASEDVFTYPIPAEGVPVRHLVEDAERVLAKKITCSETALAQTKPIRIVGLPREPRPDALRLFQALFLTLRLSLVEVPGLGLVLESRDSSGSSIRSGGFYWIDDVASQKGQHPIKAVILLRHASAQDLRDAILPFFDPRNARFNELIEPNGWVVDAPPATIVRMLEVVRALDVPPDSMPTTR